MKHVYAFIERVINWYTAKKLQWLEDKIKATRKKQNKIFEKKIMTSTAIIWNKLKKYDSRLKANNVKRILIQRKDGRFFLVDENDPICNEKE